MAKLPLSEDESASLGAFLDERLAETACDHSLRHTKAWILRSGVARRSKRILDGLQRRGGFCDCEVRNNAIP